MAHVEAPSLWTWAAGRGQHETASSRGWEAWENVQRGLIFFNDIIDILSSCGRFPGGSDGKESACNAGGDPGLIPGLGRSPGEGNGNPLHCSSLENPVDRGAWYVAVCRVTKSWT